MSATNAELEDALLRTIASARLLADTLGATHDTLRLLERRLKKLEDAT